MNQKPDEGSDQESESIEALQVVPAVIAQLSISAPYRSRAEDPPTNEARVDKKPEPYDDGNPSLLKRSAERGVRDEPCEAGRLFAKSSRSSVVSV